MLTLIGGALLALTGYSAGTIATSRRRGAPLPEVVDAIAAIGAVAGALTLFGGTRWVLAWGPAIGLAAGAVMGLILVGRRRVLAADEMAETRLERLKAFSRRMGQFQGRLLLLLFYLLIVPPFALLAKRSARPRPVDGSHWVPVPASEATLAEARQQH